MTSPEPITLLELNTRLQQAVAAAPGIHGVWVSAETSDVRLSGGHCYLELIEKDPDTGAPRARMRATIWRSAYGRLSDSFRAVTGCAFTSGIKVMVRVNAGFHPVYGISVNIDAINPEYTLGDLLRRRRELIKRLTDEGIIDLNRELEWPAVPQRIAIISAAGAAGYGDFVHQLFTNRRCLRFSAELFPAVLQGAEAPATIIAALDEIAARQDEFDCVVLIRGGGATGDLAAFDHYGLAAHIALFPLPVVVGIGHERDITLLDYVANMRVKTPTAAAEWLIGRASDALDRVTCAGAEILRLATERINSAALRLEAVRAELPVRLQGIIESRRRLLGEQLEEALRHNTEVLISRHKDRLRAAGELIEAMSPAATLRRGFSITRAGGRTVTDASTLSPGTCITTTLAHGEITSITQ